MDTLRWNEKNFNLFNSTYKTLDELENYKNESIHLNNKEQLINGFPTSFTRSTQNSK